jgi:hypothetical protein
MGGVNGTPTVNKLGVDNVQISKTWAQAAQIRIARKGDKGVAYFPFQIVRRL